MIIIAALALIAIHAVVYVLSRLLARIKQAESKSDENRNLWREYIILSPTGILILNSEGAVKEINPAAEKMLGLNNLKTAGLSITRIFPEDFYFREYLENPDALSVRSREIEYRHPRGDIITLSLNTAPLKEGAGHLVSCMDITEIREFQRQKDFRRRQVQTIIDLIPTMIYIKDARGVFLMVNQSCAQSMGYTIDEIVGKNHRDLHDYPDEVDMMLASDRKVLISGEKYHAGEEVLTSKNGSNIYIDTVKIPYITDDTGEMAVLGVSSDITDKVLLQREVHRNESLRSLGVLAGGIAHDFNNQLMGIMGYLELLGLEPQSEKGLEYLAGIRTASRKSADLVRDLLSFSREYHKQNSRLDIHKVLDAAIRFVHSTAGDAANSIKCHFHSRVKSVTGDSNLLQSAFQNLIRNAVESLGPSGHIEVSTRDQKGEDVAQVFGSVTPGETDYLLISIKDDGKGMSEEIQNHIFEPFFTTKTGQSCSGMGMAAVYGIVKSHRGYIDVQSTPGKGSLFRIYLPFDIPDRQKADL